MQNQDISIIGTCDKGCIKTAMLFNEKEEYDDLEIDTECFREIQTGNYGHINYAVCAYAAKNGHLQCLMKIHRTTDLDWHTDLAMVAYEEKHWDCYNYIRREMGR